MRTIHKFPLEITDVQTINIEPNASLLSVAFQRDTLCVWAEVADDRAYAHPRNIWIVGTGNPMPDADLHFIGTVLMEEVGLVWHVYEEV